MPKAALIMGSKSDYDIVKDCIATLEKFGVDVTVRILSAHRTPKESADFAQSARENGYEVLLCAAGKAAHLPGVMAAYTTLPIIGIPIQASALDGMDALLSMVQMPPGIPVATVAINGAVNAALLAVQMLSIKHTHLVQMLDAHRVNMAASVLEADAQIQGAK